MTFHKTIALFFIIACLLMFYGCYPTYHLQQFSSQLLVPVSSPVMLSNQKPRSYVLSAGIAGLPAQNTYRFSDNSFYDFSTSSVNLNYPNVRLEFPPLSGGLLASIQGTNLVTGNTEFRFSVQDNRIFYDASLGVGVRLYNQHMAGLVMPSIGMLNTYDDILVVEHNDYGTFDLWDSEMRIHPAFGLSLLAQSANRQWFLNFFFSASCKYIFLLEYKSISIEFISPSLAGGVYWKLGKNIAIAYARGTYLCGLGMIESNPIWRNIAPEVCFSLQRSFWLK